MKKLKRIGIILSVCCLFVSVLSLTACLQNMPDTERENESQTTTEPETTDILVTAGEETYRGFTLDRIYPSSVGDIHYNFYIPACYDGSEPYALFISLCGYGGYYFQGVGANIRTEEFVFEAQKYNQKMIIAAPQLSDWGITSAEQTVALTEYLLKTYNIDRSNVFINGYSGAARRFLSFSDCAPSSTRRLCTWLLFGTEI